MLMKFILNTEMNEHFGPSKISESIENSETSKEELEIGVKEFLSEQTDIWSFLSDRRLVDHLYLNCSRSRSKR